MNANAIGNYDFYSDFRNYSINHLGISSLQFHHWEKLQERVYGAALVPNGSLTPYVAEPNKLDVTMIDIFSRLLIDRTLWFAGVVNDHMSTVVQAQLLYLSMLDSKSDITCYIDSPGGSVKSGLSMVDTIEFINPDVATTCTGMAASMGSVLLGCGAKGKRTILPHSKVMLHQVSHGTQGNVQDTRINQVEAEKYNDELMRLLGTYTGKSAEEIREASSRDLWLTGKEAVDFGICDSVVGTTR